MQDWVYGTMSAAELAEQERITSEYLYALVNTVSAHLNGLSNKRTASFRLKTKTGEDWQRLREDVEELTAVSGRWAKIINAIEGALEPSAS